ncbi:hypothetical protein PR048_004596 [Dryococelus australis]|uniref:HAT C-terminal dimerisation domain-containing protein n=1 Tax=Dryococelus australis TaxID=614101 RepID=A0ABQ9I5V9_9NEOP|nr:hypothetical protein PR048_004596 [Dryococelus australis]
MQRCLLTLAMAGGTKEGDKFDDVQLLLAAKLRYPEFSEVALICLWLPASSVKAEVFFSKFNFIIIPKLGAWRGQTHPPSMKGRCNTTANPTQTTCSKSSTCSAATVQRCYATLETNQLDFHQIFTEVVLWSAI